MYLPPHFKEQDRKKTFELIRNNPLATIVVAGDDRMDANHIPLYLDSHYGENGRLLGHVPRSNPLSKTSNSSEVLAIFHGPNSYISPSWYPTKKETGKVVPTWNYQVVHTYGTLRILDDPEWVIAQIEKLTKQSEANFSEPWQISDAPHEFTSQLLKMLVGFEIQITEIISKSKLSQNQPERNRLGIFEGLKSTGRTSDEEMAEVIAEAVAGSKK